MDEVEVLRVRLTAVEIEMCAMKERLVRYEAQDRRNNVMFFNVAEERGETWEATETLVRDILDRFLGMNRVSIERAHRVGPPMMGKTRPIIVKMSFYKDREMILGRRGGLRSTSIQVEEDLPRELRDRRKALFQCVAPIARERGERVTLRYPFKEAYVGRQRFVMGDLGVGGTRSADRRDMAAPALPSSHIPAVSKHPATAPLVPRRALSVPPGAWTVSSAGHGNGQRAQSQPVEQRPGPSAAAAVSTSTLGSLHESPGAAEREAVREATEAMRRMERELKEEREKREAERKMWEKEKTAAEGVVVVDEETERDAAAKRSREEANLSSSPASTSSGSSEDAELPTPQTGRMKQARMED
jgi:hypothetical protein